MTLQDVCRDEAYAQERAVFLLDEALASCGDDGRVPAFRLREFVAQIAVLDLQAQALRALCAEPAQDIDGYRCAQLAEAFWSRFRATYVFMSSQSHIHRGRGL